MKGRRVALGLAALAIVGLALATDHGVWSCGSCTLQGATPDYETVAFIESTVNNSVSRWVNGDTVTICNGTTCAKYLMASVFGGIEGMQQVVKYPKMSGGGGGGGGDIGAIGGATGPITYISPGCYGLCGRTPVVSVGDPKNVP